MKVVGSTLTEVLPSDISDGTFNIPVGIDTIGDYVFNDLPELTHIYNLHTIRKVGDNSLCKLDSLGGHLALSGVLSIGRWSINNLPKIDWIYLTSLKELDQSSIYNIRNLDTVYTHQGRTKIYHGLSSFLYVDEKCSITLRQHILTNSNPAPIRNLDQYKGLKEWLS
jgi:hypothetical protein